jgi:hypothetical protein
MQARQGYNYVASTFQGEVLRDSYDQWATLERSLTSTFEALPRRYLNY